MKHFLLPGQKGTAIIVRGPHDFEKALKVFKENLERGGVFREMKHRRPGYQLVKPGDIKRDKKKSAIRYRLKRAKKIARAEASRPISLTRNQLSAPYSVRRAEAIGRKVNSHSTSAAKSFDAPRGGDTSKTLVME